MTRNLSSWPIQLLIAGLAAASVSATGASLTEIGPWYRDLAKPDWTPPDAAFPIVWTTIFALTAIASVLAWCNIPDRRAGVSLLVLFAFNGFFNVFWSLLFFKLQRPDYALIEVVFLWLSILGLIVVCARYSKTAGVLLVPYLAWVTVAATLNYSIVQFNPPFG